MTIVQYGLACHIVWMKTTMSLDDALVREAMAIHRGKTKTAVVELGLQELINADRRRRLGEAFGSQPDLRTVARRRSAGDPALTVLIDTSVWLRFLRGEEAGLVAQSWITSGQALVHPFVSRRTAARRSLR